MSIELPPYRPVTRRSGLKVMGAALHALMMRELQTRFGSFRLGYLWAPLEVLFQVAIYLVIFGTLMQRTMPGIDYILFLVAGLVPYQMLNRIASRSLGAVEANQGLLMYRAVRHFDVIFARSLLELIIYFFTFVLLLVFLAFLGIGISFSHLNVVLFCWLTLFLFSLGLALIMMIIGYYGGEIGKVVSLIFTILYFTSGIIYSITVIPEPYMSYLLYIPFVHNLELIRHSLAPNYPSYHIDFTYFLECMIVVDFVGLLMYKAFERDFIRTK